MNDKVKLLLISIVAVALAVIAMLSTTKNCWNQYQTEVMAIQNCEGN